MHAHSTPERLTPKHSRRAARRMPAACKPPAEPPSPAAQARILADAATLADEPGSLVQAHLAEEAKGGAKGGEGTKTPPAGGASAAGSGALSRMRTVVVKERVREEVGHARAPHPPPTRPSRALLPCTHLYPLPRPSPPVPPRPHR